MHLNKLKKSFICEICLNFGDMQIEANGDVIQCDVIKPAMLNNWTRGFYLIAETQAGQVFCLRVLQIKASKVSDVRNVFVRSLM